MITLIINKQKYQKGLKDTFIKKQFESLEKEIFILDWDTFLENPEKEKKIIKESELFFTIGGDGTFLACSHLLLTYEKPIIGINIGNIGFLTLCDLKDLTKNLLLLKKKEIPFSKHLVLETTFNEKTYFAINEFYLQKTLASEMLELEVYSNDFLLYHLRCDGFMVTSPFGSTAHYFSYTDHVFFPEIKAIHLLPIGCFNGPKTKISLPTSSTIKIKICNEKQSSFVLTSDGQILDFENSCITIKQSSHLLTSPTCSEKHFFEAFRKKIR